MKFLLSALFSISVLFSFGQNKYVKKSERLFQKGKYEKCISKTKKFLKKNRKSPELQYYIVQSYLELYHEASEKKKISALRRTITAWEKLERYHTDENDYSHLKSKIIANIKSEIQSGQLKNNRKADYYHNKMAIVFHDTSEYYKLLHPELFNHKKTEHKIVDDNETSSFENLCDVRIRILKAAKKVVGTRYKYAGVDSTGFDCSGFTQYAYHSAGIEIPHNANMQSKMGNTIDISQAQAGDLIFFGSGSRAYHAGIIYSNNNGEIELIHCASRGVTLQTYDDENTKYWLKHILRVQQIIPSDVEKNISNQ